MYKYFFVLGRYPHFSISEIKICLQNRKKVFKIEASSNEVLVICTPDPIDDKLAESFGGTVKTGIILDEVRLDEENSLFNKILSPENLLEKYFPQKGGKINFGISIYQLSPEGQIMEKVTNLLNALYIQIKEGLRQKGRNSRFIKGKERMLNSVLVDKNQLIKKGADISILVDREKLLIGKTISVQDYEGFSYRDFYRPGKDKKSGIMPPKLARMMINFAQIKEGESLLDPFCGSGTVIMEAVMMRIKNLTATDINEKAINDTKKNIDWLFGSYKNLARNYYQIKVEKIDVSDIARLIPPASIGAVVTEPYLGPPLQHSPNTRQIEEIFRQVTGYYLDSFRQFHKILEKGGRIIIIFPAFEAGGELKLIPILEEIGEMGFRFEKIVDEKMLTVQSQELTIRETLLFASKFSFVKREIIKFVKY